MNCFIFILGLVILISIRNSFGNEELTSCTYVKNSLLKYSCRWLYGEIPVTGLSNQITTVYTLLSLSKFLNSSLIVGYVYSRSSFELTMRAVEQVEGNQRLLFSDIFDETMFETLAKSYQLRMVTNPGKVAHCINSLATKSDSLNVYTIQRKGWKSSSKQKILQMLQDAGYNTSSVSYPCPHILRFKSVGKLLGMYSFRDNNGAVETEELLHIHRHIKPAPIIQQQVTALLKLLPVHFFAMHVRVEPDVYPRSGNWSAQLTLRSKRRPQVSLAITEKVSQLLLPFDSIKDKDPNFYYNLADWIQSILQSKCYQGYKGTQLPPLYIASGIISKLYYPTGSVGHYINDGSSARSNYTVTSQIDRGAIILHIVQQLGFQKLHSKLDLLYHRDRRRLFDDNILNVNSTNSSVSTHTLPVELEAYIDLEIARRSRCFIPAHIRSSFSYLVQRFQELDMNITKSTIGKPNAAYKAFFI